MRGNYWFISLLFALVVISLSREVFVFLRQDRANRSGNTDKSYWFLILLLIAAFLSIMSFIAFVFLRGIVGWSG